MWSRQFSVFSGYKLQRRESYCYTFTCTWVLATWGGLGATPGFFLVTIGELSLFRLGVRQSGGRSFELWDTIEEVTSTNSPSMVDRQLRSELLKRLMLSPDDSVLSTKAETDPLRHNNKESCDLFDTLKGKKSPNSKMASKMFHIVQMWYICHSVILNATTRARQTKV